MNTYCRKIFWVLAASVLLAGGAYADTFEFLRFSPPSGWTKQASENATIYKRPTGIGMAAFYPSYSATGSPADEFARMWRARVTPTVPGPAPQPQIEREGQSVAAVGAKQVDAQGTLTTISLVTMISGGRAVGIMTMGAGEDVMRELTAFLDSLKVTAESGASASAGGIEVEYDVPAGYTAQRDGNAIILKPVTLDRNTPCIYGISPARSSTGKLETDAAAAVLEPLPGWQVKSEHYNAMRGTAGGGWPYYWLRTDVQRLNGPSYEYLTAMATAFPAGTGRVNILWGFGATGICSSDDHAFLRLFHSLRPRGVSPDGGQALARELLGTWRDTQAAGMAQYRFLPNGRYEYGLGTSTTFGNLETRTGSAKGGRYVLRDSELTLTPDTAGRGTSKFRVRIYDHYNKGGWLRTMSLFDENAKPPAEVEYARVTE